MAYNIDSTKNVNGGGSTEIISPMLDVMFKRMFSIDSGAPMLCNFLETFIDFNGNDVSSANLMDKEIKRYPDDKGSILDLRVEAGGAEIDVEVQLMKLDGDRERFTLYLSKMYSEQLKEGMDYSEVHNCKSLIILDYTMPEYDRNNEFFHSFKFRDENGIVFSDALEMGIIEIPRIRDIKITQGLDDRVMWAKLFAAKSKGELDMIGNSTSNAEIKKAVYVVKQLSENQVLRREAEARVKAINDEKARLRAASKEGLAKGIAEGRAEGRAEGTEKMAQALRDMGYDENMIAEAVKRSQGNQAVSKSPQAQQKPQANKKTPPKRGGR